MLKLLRLTLSMILFSPSANAQVLDPSWIYAQVLQKTLRSKGRTIASITKNYEGLKVRETDKEDGWKLVENKPLTEVKSRILLLPGFLGTDYVFQEMLRDPEMAKQGYQLIAGNAPGFAGLKVAKGFRFSIEEYADLVEKLAEKEKFDVLVGHSYMATVLGEVALRGKFKGKIVMMSPALEPDDEPISTRALDVVTRDPLLRDLAWLGMYQYMEEGFSEFFQPGDTKHLDEAAAEARLTPKEYAERMLVQYFNYLRSERSFTKEMHLTHANILYINGGKDVVSLKDDNKETLTASGKVKFIHLPNASHMLMIDEPKKINALLRSF